MHSIISSPRTGRLGKPSLPIASERKAGAAKHLNWTPVCGHGMHCHVTFCAEEMVAPGKRLQSPVTK